MRMDLYNMNFMILLPLALIVSLEMYPFHSMTVIAQTNSFLKTYESPDFGISVQYPSDWRVYDDMADPNSEFTTIVSFTAGDLFDGSVDISVNNNPVTSNLNNLLDDEIQIYQDSMKGFEFIDSTTAVSLTGYPAYSFEFYGHFKEDNLQGDELRNMAVGAIINGKQYIIEYYATSANYLTNLQNAYKIINSFQVTSPIIASQPQNGTATGIAPIPSSPSQSPFNVNFEQQCINYFFY